MGALSASRRRPPPQRDWRQCASPGWLAWLLVHKVKWALGFGSLGQLRGAGTERSKGDLGLKPGDVVEVRPAEGIAATLDRYGKNNGLTFDPEMGFYRGLSRRADARTHHPGDDRQNADADQTVTLKGVTCQGMCAKNSPAPTPSTGARSGCAKSLRPPLALQRPRPPRRQFRSPRPANEQEQIDQSLDLIFR